MSPLCHTCWWTEEQAAPLLEAAGIPLHQVDAYNIVPVWITHPADMATSTRLRDEHATASNYTCWTSASTVVAAVMVLSGHLKSDIECHNKRDSLLITDSGCFVKCSETPDQEGAYLYFDMVRQVFVRSGKVAGHGFVSRGDEHVAQIYSHGDTIWLSPPMMLYQAIRDSNLFLVYFYVIEIMSLNVNITHVMN
jgi:hypothetical protein